MTQQLRDFSSGSSFVETIKEEWSKHADSTEAMLGKSFCNHQEDILRRITEKGTEAEAKLAKRVEGGFQSFASAQQKKFEKYLSTQAEILSTEWKNMQKEQEERLSRQLSEEL